MFGWACSGNHRTGKHHHHAGKICLTFAYSSHNGCLSRNQKPCFCFFFNLSNGYVKCVSDLWLLVLCCLYVFSKKKKGYFCVVLREEEWRNVGYYCNDGWEDEEGIWVFFLLWNIKELMWVVGRRRRSEFWCDLGLWKSKNKRKKWKMEADDDDGHLFFEALMCQTIFLVIFYFFIS